jgi:uncharacterized damage-inducible protein DinB
LTDEELRIRSYLQAQGAKLAPAAIIDKVRVAMAELRAAAESVPPSRFAERPSTEEWSANEVMAHVVSAGAHFATEIVRALDGATSGARGARNETPPSRSASEWCAELERDREALFARVVRADPNARLDARIEHGMFGALNWRETLLFMRLHDLDHVGQLEKIAAVLSARSA